MLPPDARRILARPASSLQPAITPDPAARRCAAASGGAFYGVNTGTNTSEKPCSWARDTSPTIAGISTAPGMRFDSRSARTLAGVMPSGARLSATAELAWPSIVWCQVRKMTPRRCSASIPVSWYMLVGSSGFCDAVAANRLRQKTLLVAGAPVPGSMTRYFSPNRYFDHAASAYVKRFAEAYVATTTCRSLGGIRYEN